MICFSQARPLSSTTRLSLIRANSRRLRKSNGTKSSPSIKKSVFLVTQAVVGAMRQREKRVGTHHQPVFSRRPDGRGSGSALRRVHDGDYRADPLRRCIAHSRRNHRERHCSGVDRDRYGDQQPEDIKTSQAILSKRNDWLHQSPSQSRNQRYSGSLQLFASENSLGTRSCPQIFRPARFGHRTKKSFLSLKYRSIASFAASADG